MKTREQTLKNSTGSGWQHVDGEKGHPPDPHYTGKLGSAASEWVCYDCHGALRKVTK